MHTLWSGCKMLAVQRATKDAEQPSSGTAASYNLEPLCGSEKIKKEKKKKKEKKEEEQAKDWQIKICNLHLAAMARRREAKERWLASLPPVPLFSS